MSQINVIRAWKDEEYRLSLTEAERARLPEHPAGLLDPTEAELQQATGGAYLGTFARPSWVGGCPSATVCPTLVGDIRVYQP